MRKDAVVPPKKFKGTILVFFLWSLFSALLHAEEHNTDVAVIVSSQIRPYVMALEGLRSSLQQPLKIYYLNLNPELIRHNLSQEHHDLLIAIGPEASVLAWSNLNPGDKKIALMVLDQQKLLEDPEPCGVDLRIPIKEQIKLIKERLGGRRKIGILYNPMENRGWVEQARRHGSDLGVSVIPLRVHNRHEITKVLSSAYQDIDTLLFIPDSTVISMALLSHLVKDALLHGIAVVGYNHFFMEIGAVLAFNIDYERVGILGAELARDVLSGSKCRLTPPPFHIEWSEKVWKTINDYSGSLKSRSSGDVP